MFGRVAEYPQLLAIGRRQAHLQRVFDPMAFGDFLDQTRHSLHRCDRVIGQSQRQRQVEHQLRIRRSLDRSKQVGIDGHGQFTFDGAERADQPVVHPQPTLMAKRVAVRLLYGRAGRRADVREKQSRPDVHRQLAQVSIVPCRCDRTIKRGLPAVAVPANDRGRRRWSLSTPIRACSLWSISECSGSSRKVSSAIGEPEYASQRHIRMAAPA